MASGQMGLCRVVVEKPVEERGVASPAFWDGVGLDTIRLDVIVTGLWTMINWCFYDGIERLLEGPDAVVEK